MRTEKHYSNIKAIKTCHVIRAEELDKVVKEGKATHVISELMFGNYPWEVFLLRLKNKKKHKLIK